MTSPDRIILSTVHGEWPVVMAEMKLKLRARLPGASAFDDAAAGLRAARASGVPAIALFAPAFASSWLVNSAIPSPVFQKWLVPAMRAKWAKLVALIEGDGSPWPERSKETRAEIDGLLGEIAAVGATLGGISKVLALLSLEPVPLMPDAALALVLRALPVPAEPDAQTAPLKHFAPMMDRLAQAEESGGESLAELATKVPPLRPPDAVDRVVWFDSVGYRHFKNDQGGWYWVRSESKEAVVFVKGDARPDHRIGTCVEVPADDDFSQRALSALEAAFA